MHTLNKHSDQAALPLPSSGEWLRLLRNEAELQSITGAAKRIGCARSKASMLLSGKYPAKTARAERQVLKALGSVQCPALGGEMEGSRCQQYRKVAAGDPPTHNSTVILFWRSCQICPNNGAVVVTVTSVKEGDITTYTASVAEKKATASSTVSAQRAADDLLPNLAINPDLVQCISSSEDRAKKCHTFIYREVQ